MDNNKNKISNIMPNMNIDYGKPNLSGFKRNTETEDEIKKLHETIIKLSVKTWTERNPFLFGLIMSFIGGIIGFGLAILLEQMKIYHIFHLK